MFIGTRTSTTAKLRRSGMAPGAHRLPPPGWLADPARRHAAPTELGRASGAVVTINMALLAELSSAGRLRAELLIGCPGHSDAALDGAILLHRPEDIPFVVRHLLHRSGRGWDGRPPPARDWRAKSKGSSGWSV
jgi:hypothetical protein